MNKHKFKNTFLLEKEIKKEKMKKCVYCKQEIASERVIDVCDICGKGVWGEKMFKAIISEMEKAREKGDLWQGSVNENLNKLDTNSKLSAK